MAQDPTPPPPPPPVVAPPLSAELETCETSALPAQRVASFVGSMPLRAGAARMQMRFELQRRRQSERHWRHVRGVQGFDVWETSLPGRAGFVFHKRVDGLQVPASYRAQVRFRWFDEEGRRVARGHRRTPACVQPDLRPDLVVRSLRVALDARPALAVYTVVVRNAGRSAAGPFTVSIAGVPVEVPELAAGAAIERTVVTAACARGSIIHAIVDADQRVAERDEHNASRRSCPL
ncbi:MAG: hypothetical protein H0W96_00850 [Solirubrobacterales bacterium]|nr:hypothetical protein [Solirubrobacterales bacterium]